MSANPTQPEAAVSRPSIVLSLDRAGGSESRAWLTSRAGFAGLAPRSCLRVAQRGRRVAAPLSGVTAGKHDFLTLNMLGFMVSKGVVPAWSLPLGALTF